MSMTVIERRWMQGAHSHSVGNTKQAISYWAHNMIKAARLTKQQATIANRGAKETIAQGKLRGDISERWIKDGLTNEQFHNELFL
jgi:hypothetical protein